MGAHKIHSGGISIDESLVHRLITAQFPQWSHLPIKALPSAGTNNTLYRLGQKMVVRLPRSEWTSPAIDKEHHWLPRLAPLLPLPLTHPIVKGTPTEGFPWHWSIYQWLEGEDATVAPVVDELQTATDLAEFLLALQQVDSTGAPLFGEHNCSRGGPLTVRNSNTRSAIDSLHNIFDADLMLKVWNCSMEAPAWNNPPCWIHGDLILMNLLVQKGQLSAVIDFGYLGVGDPACDLLIAWAFSAKARDIFRSALSVDDATWARGRGWALSIGLIAFKGYQDSNPVIARIAKRLIDEALTDYENFD